jgi:pSer/pThr/pTyr-binding forkhead associated (FHA) protein
VAYLRAIFDSQEIERRDLSRPLVIGRSPECDLAVRDIMLSRKHCRIEASGSDNSDENWQVIDLDSKNGTSLNGHPLIGGATLCSGDSLRLGRLEIQFHWGSLANAGLTPLKSAPLRPADPTESLSATFAGYRYLDPGEPCADINGPSPRPLPKLPAAYAREDVYSLLNALASSSWDSIYAEARKPLAAMDPAAVEVCTPMRRSRPRSPIELSLQAMPQAGDVEFGGDDPRGRKDNRRRLSRVAAGAVAAWVMVMAVLVFRAWLPGGVPSPARAQIQRPAAAIGALAVTPVKSAAGPVVGANDPVQFPRRTIDPNVAIFSQIASVTIPFLL